ncbi:MAG TPA: hypothetical protein VNQ76_07570 [Planctomicrobium sp.]|nr:hypothetical protein [Planctomicrobium sp.]
MPPQIRLHPKQIADLAEIRDTSPETLLAIRDHLLAARPAPMRPSELKLRIVEVLGEDNSEAANRIIRPLLGLQAVIRQQQLEPHGVIKAIRVALQSVEAPWKAEELDRWDNVESAFKQLLTAPIVRVVSSALDLMYEHENLLQSIRVITDIRPVFAKDAESIEGSVVTHTLRIRYDSREGDHSISIAMDEADIRELERQCKRALLKAQTAYDLMTTKAEIPTIISGDGNNA